MTTVVLNVYLVLCLLVAVGLVCAIVGAVLAILIYDRAAARTARIARTGRPEAPTKAAGVTAVPGGEFQGQSIEHEAQQRAYRNVIENGARQMMELEPGLTLEEARRKAENAMRELGAFNLGAAGS